MTAPWYESVPNLRDLFEWMCEQEAAEPGEDSGIRPPGDESQFLEFLTKPWHWEPEWRAYQRWLARDLETAPTEPPDVAAAIAQGNAHAATAAGKARAEGPSIYAEPDPDRQWDEREDRGPYARRTR